MSKDIAKILQAWEYEPDQMSVRLIRGDDGREKIQLRIELGLLQMELSGRPDGLRPEGFESWLDYYQHCFAESDAAEPDVAPMTLGASDCARLLREGIQYYHRYLSLWHLKRYELCARDTSRNLRLFAFVRQHADNDRDKLQFDQWRPYVTMMHARAVATPLEELKQYEAALSAVNAAIRGVWAFLEAYDQTHRSAECAELAQLERWRTSLESKVEKSKPKRPLDPIQRLQKMLDDAIAEERFEDAAKHRDEIARLKSVVGSSGLSDETTD